MEDRRETLGLADNELDCFKEGQCICSFAVELGRMTLVEHSTRTCGLHYTT